MKVTSISDFRRESKKFFDEIISDQEALIITRSDGATVVAVPLDEYNALTETDYLLSSPANRRHLQKSIAQLERGETVVKAIDELSSHEQARR